MASALQTLTELGTQFLVFGRSINGVFTELADLNLPQALGKLCTGVTESEFRNDISSTQIRNNSA